ANAIMDVTRDQVMSVSDAVNAQLEYFDALGNTIDVTSQRAVELFNQEYKNARNDFNELDANNSAFDQLDQMYQRVNAQARAYAANQREITAATANETLAEQGLIEAENSGLMAMGGHSKMAAT